jgi:hypothetical protein
MVQKKRIFLICSVRNASDEQKAAQAAYINKLEAEGHKVYWPHRDNKSEETDPVGLEIIDNNLEGILSADEVHVIWDPASQGSVADLEAAMALRKPIHLVNKDQFKPTQGKSYTNVVLHIDTDYTPSRIHAEVYGFAGAGE